MTASAPAAPVELFEAWLAEPWREPAAPSVGAAVAQAASKEALKTVLTDALRRYAAAPELPDPPQPRDRDAERQRRAIVEVVPPGKVERAELCHTLNAGHDARATVHIDRCRQHLEDEERAQQAAAKQDGLALFPNRRERPVATSDVSRVKIHREARIMMMAIVNSRGAYVIQGYLRKFRAIFSGQPLAALRDAALLPLAQGGFRWTYADECARRRIAIGLCWLVCGTWTNQRTAFGSRSTRRGLVIAGLSVDRMLRAVTPIGRKKYDRHVFGSRTNKRWQGDMWHFERAGFAIRKRLPAARCNAWEIGPSGQPRNRYWIGCVVSTRDPRQTRRRSRSMSALGDLAGLVAFTAAAHDLGWQWCEEPITYAPPPPPTAAPPEPPF